MDDPIYSCTDLDSGFDLDCENIFDIVWNEIPSGFIDSTYNFFPTDIDSLTILCGPENNNWQDNATVYDPNGDNYSENNNSGTEDNEEYDIGENFEDINQDGLYNSPPSNYNEELNL